MSQSKWMSFIEAVVNTLIGLVIAFLLNALLMAAAGVTASAMQNAFIVIGHTVVSVVRSYVVRRAFNSEFWVSWKGWLAMRKKRLLCKHREGKVLEIAFDGESVIECNSCGKVFRLPL